TLNSRLNWWMTNEREEILRVLRRTKYAESATSRRPGTGAQCEPGVADHVGCRPSGGAAADRRACRSRNPSPHPPGVPSSASPRGGRLFPPARSERGRGGPAQLFSAPSWSTSVSRAAAGAEVWPGGSIEAGEAERSAGPQGGRRSAVKPLPSPVTALRVRHRDVRYGSPGCLLRQSVRPHPVSPGIVGARVPRLPVPEDGPVVPLDGHQTRHHRAPSRAVTGVGNDKTPVRAVGEADGELSDRAFQRLSRRLLQRQCPGGDLHSRRRGAVAEDLAQDRGHREQFTVGGRGWEVTTAITKEPEGAPVGDLAEVAVKVPAPQVGTGPFPRGNGQGHRVLTVRGRVIRAWFLSEQVGCGAHREPSPCTGDRGTGQEDLHVRDVLDHVRAPRPPRRGCRRSAFFPVPTALSAAGSVLTLCHRSGAPHSGRPGLSNSARRSTPANRRTQGAATTRALPWAPVRHNVCHRQRVHQRPMKAGIL